MTTELIKTKLFFDLMIELKMICSFFRITYIIIHKCLKMYKVTANFKNKFWEF